MASSRKRTLRRLSPKEDAAQHLFSQRALWYAKRRETYATDLPAALEYVLVLQFTGGLSFEHSLETIRGSLAAVERATE